MNNKLYSTLIKAVMILFTAMLLFSVCHAQNASLEPLVQKAEKAYQNQSWAEAERLFNEILEHREDFSKNQLNWLQLHYLAAKYRNTYTQSSTKNRKKLNAIWEQIQELEKDQQDEFWAEIQETLGDLEKMSQNRNSSPSLYHIHALDYWAAQTDIEKAKKRYIILIQKVIDNAFFSPNYLPSIQENILSESIQLVDNQDDLLKLNLLLANQYQHKPLTPATYYLIQRQYEKLLGFPVKTPHYDRVLFSYAQWLEQQGRQVKNSNNRYSYSPDYEKALTYYQKIVKQFSKEKSPYWEQAKDRIKTITEPQINLFFSIQYTPGSQIEYALSYNNLSNIQVSLYPIDLNRDIHPLKDKILYRSTYLEAVSVQKKKPVYTESFSPETNNWPHFPSRKDVSPKDIFPAGAYLLEAKSGTYTTRELILITDIALIAKSAPEGENLLYLGNAFSGEPIPDAELHLIHSWNRSKEIFSKEQTLHTDTDGIARFASLAKENYGNILVTAKSGDLQTLLFLNTQAQSDPNEDFCVYVFTDRPVYRPQEKVQWKTIVRSRKNGILSTSTGIKLDYAIHSPNDEVIKSGTVTLNDFGSAYDSLTLTPEMRLGEYQIEFKQNGKSLEWATFFRLEEYKLPEYKVNVTPTGENYRLGDTIQAMIQAEYYFGGPVADAELTVQVRQKNYNHHWIQLRRYPWLYEDDFSGGNWQRNNTGEVILTKTLKTDPSGQAKIEFETPLQMNRDLEYSITATLLDSAGREITAQNNIKVTSFSYYVQLKPAKTIITPGESAVIEITAEDANGKTHSAQGQIEVTRKYYVERWQDPNGDIVEGEKLETYKKQVGYENFPPSQEKGKAPWRLKFSNYRFEKILTQEVSTDQNGRAQFRFPLEKPGCYQVSWTSADTLTLGNDEKIPWDNITASTSLWCADGNTRTVQIKEQGITLILDENQAKVGHSLPIMIQTDHPGHHILLTSEAHSIIGCQMIHIEGDAQLVAVPITEAHTPNVWFTATMLANANVFQNSQKVIVPSEKNFITIEMTPSSPVQKPRDKGKVSIRTLDANGKPIQAEVALGIADEALYAIQNEYAKDPREFFSNPLRWQQVRTYNSFWRPLVSRKADTEESEEEQDDLAEYENEEIPLTLGIGGAAPERRMLAKNSAMTLVVKDDVAYAEAMAPNMAMAAGDGDMISPDQVTVRNDFQSTIFWEPEIVTDADGYAEVEVTYPDNLTQWRLTSRANTKGSQFGIQQGEVRVRQPLMTRLQAPRFFTVGDTVHLSAIINNDTEKDLNVGAILEIENEDILRMQGQKEITVVIPAKGEKRVIWEVKALSPGNIKIKTIARSSQEADAMEKSYTVYAHGIEKFIARSGKLNQGSADIIMNLPKERKETACEIQLTPCLAAGMLDALPYLFDYPYGCTEQTMSRFLPAVIVKRTLTKLNIPTETIENQLFGGREKDSNAPGSGTKKSFSQLDEITQKSLDRLYDHQHQDGSWGWWKESSADPYMSAYVVWGLQLARSAGIDVKEDALKRGTQWLDEHLVAYDGLPQIQCWMLHALSMETNQDSIKHYRDVFDRLYKNREHLTAYTRALLTLSAVRLEKNEEAHILSQNIENGVIRDDNTDQTVLFKQTDTDQTGGDDLNTLHWGESGYWWYHNQIESTAFSIAALIAADPQSPLIQPAVNWIIKNRRGTQWNNTRDTALCILALCDFIQTNRELENSVSYSIEVNGSPVGAGQMNFGKLNGGTMKIWVDPSLFHEGDNHIVITKLEGEAPVYFSTQIKYFSMEEPITAAGNEIFVRRQYYKLDSIPTLLKGPATQKTLLKNSDHIESGDHIEVVLTLESKNEYEYLLFEDMKPGGFEAVQLKSGAPIYIQELSEAGIRRRAAASIHSELMSPGSNPKMPPWWNMISSSDDGDYTGKRLWVYQEQRDQKTASFIDHLSEGVWELRYEYRAETPGQFHALPVLGEAMYVPELRCNSDESLIGIDERND